MLTVRREEKLPEVWVVEATSKKHERNVGLGPRIRKNKYFFYEMFYFDLQLELDIVEMTLMF